MGRRGEIISLCAWHWQYMYFLVKQFPRGNHTCHLSEQCLCRPGLSNFSVHVQLDSWSSSSMMNDKHDNGHDLLAAVVGHRTGVRVVAHMSTSMLAFNIALSIPYRSIVPLTVHHVRSEPCVHGSRELKRFRSLWISLNNYIITPLALYRTHGTGRPHLHEFDGHQFEAFLLESFDDFSHDATLDTIGLHHNKRTLPLRHDFLGKLRKKGEQSGNHVTYISPPPPKGRSRD